MSLEESGARIEATQSRAYERKNKLDESCEAPIFRRFHSTYTIYVPSKNAEKRFSLSELNSGSLGINIGKSTCPPIIQIPAKKQVRPWRSLRKIRQGHVQVKYIDLASSKGHYRFFGVALWALCRPEAPEYVCMEDFKSYASRSVTGDLIHLKKPSRTHAEYMQGKRR